jgi:ubiquitin-protein ligase E3 C
VPLDYLPSFISRLPIAKLDSLNPLVPHILKSTTIVSKIHLTANLYMFISPRYKLLPSPAFSTYLQLSTSLFNDIPLSVFKRPPMKAKKSNKAWGREGSDSDSDHITPPTVDDKTLKRLQNLVATRHLASLISNTQSKSSLFPHVVTYLFALASTWPSSQDEIFNAILASTSGGLVRQLYHDLVRQSPLGKEEDSGNVFGTSILHPCHP